MKPYMGVLTVKPLALEGLTLGLTGLDRWCVCQAPSSPRQALGLDTKIVLLHERKWRRQARQARQALFLHTLKICRQMPCFTYIFTKYRFRGFDGLDGLDAPKPHPHIWEWRSMNKTQ